MIIRLISPHFRTCVVRRSRLSVEQSLLGDLTDVHVSEFGRSILAQEDVGTLEVSVEDVDFVQ